MGSMGPSARIALLCGLLLASHAHFAAATFRRGRGLLQPQPAGDSDVVVAAASVQGVDVAALQKAADQAGMPLEQLAKLAAHDPDVIISDTGNMAYSCFGHGHDHEAEAWTSVEPQELGGEVEAASPSVLFNDSSIPLTWEAVSKMHSRPEATRKVFLKFDGCETSNTAWNTARFSQDGGRLMIATPPYDINADPAFTVDELRNIVDIWRAVAADYALWDVDVTMEDPGNEGIDRWSMDDLNYGMRVCIGGMASSWVAGVAPGTDVYRQPLGIALMNSYGVLLPPNGSPPDQYLKDVFVFSRSCPTTKQVWESVSHEIGHTLGLSHDGFWTIRNGVEVYEQYYRGNTAFAPIMGYAGGAQFTQWNNGQYPAGAKPNNTEDDLAIIGDVRRNGLPPLADEAGNTAETALALCSASNCSEPEPSTGRATVRIDAIANSGTDKDFFSFTAGVPGNAIITIDYVPVWIQRVSETQAFVAQRGNLRLDLAFSDGAVILDKGGPYKTNAWRQVMRATLPAAGTYTFWVQPTTLTDPDNTLQLPTNYGNVGDYTITLEFPQAQPVLPSPSPSPVPSPSPSPLPSPSPSPSPQIPPIENCVAKLDCDILGLCTAGCGCLNETTCKCNATQGFTAGTYRGLPQCMWALQKWVAAPTKIGYFRAKTNTRVRLPWSLLSGGVAGCPAAGKKVLKAAGITIGTTLSACPTGTPVSLAAATITQANDFQSCSRGSGYTVFTAKAAGVASTVAKRCRMLTVKTSDGRTFTGTIYVSK